MHPTSSVLLQASLLALLGAAAGAQPAFLVRDLQTSTTNSGSDPLPAVVWKDRAYFIAADFLHGQELWTTNGTRGGTRIVRDVSPGSAGSATLFGQFSHLAASDDRLWLTRDDGVAGDELWTSDGTAAGTRLVRDLCPGPCDTYVQEIFAGRDAVFFSVGDEELGLEPWVSDGTSEGTHLLKDVCPGPCGSGPSLVGRLGDVTLFEASDEEHGRELWRSDGTEAGTALVKDVCRGPCNGVLLSPRVALGGEIFFAGNDGGRGLELWKSDGTAEGTVRVRDMCPSCLDVPIQPFAFGAGLLVVARSGRELWKSDGTAEGTVLFATLPRDHYVSSPLWAVGPATALFFVRRLGQSGGQLWRTDGTGAGTLAVSELEEVVELGAVAGGRLVFTAGSPRENLEPWASDGTPEGTRRLREIRSHPARGSFPGNFTSLGPSRVLFTAFNGRGFEPWITDGTPAGTRLLKDVNRRDASANPTELTAFGGRLFFAAGSDHEGRSLWTSDGTAAGTTIVGAGLDPLEITAGPDRLFFTGSDSESHRQPWVSDGTPEGSERLSPSPPLAGFAYELVTLGGTLFFAEGGEHRGQRLWRSDGTSEGTVVVKDLEPDWYSGCGILFPGACADYVDFPRDLTPLGGTLFLVGSDFEHGAELWKSDGTEAGTERVADLEPGEGGSDPRELTAAGEHLFFTASVGGVRRLWSTDGTGTATVAVDAGEPRELVALGATLYFVAAVGSDGDGLFVCEGACIEAALVKELGDAGSPGYASRLAAVDDRLFFAVFSEATGQELWTSDGTAEGTEPVTEIAPGRHGSFPQSFAAVDGRLFFAADDGRKGLELWHSDGTAEGTCRVQDLARGRTPASPGDFVVAGDLVFFAAADVRAGRELWAIPRADPCRLRRLMEAVSKP